MITTDATRVCFFGAAPDTGNLGVSALCYSVLGPLSRRLPATQITVFDHGRGIRRSAAEFEHGRFEYDCCGAVNSRRFYRGENLWNIRIAARLGGFGNHAALRILQSDAMLDISGGDSFTDLYGPHRFNSITLPKLTAIEQQIPLVLLPQTYGPYNDRRHFDTARRIVAGAAAAWARDRRSYDALQELLGKDFDPGIHHCGVDVAFALDAIPPRSGLSPRLMELLSTTGDLLVGLNVSGLIYNNPAVARRRYDLRADYRAVIHELLLRVLRRTDATILLVPHVLTPPGHYESDYRACGLARDALPEALQQRVELIPPRFDCCEMKWIISRTAWFCGTRMHSTIAALSTGVPTAAIAYSSKTQGVFETCGQGRYVADPRHYSTEETVDQLWHAFGERNAARDTLAFYLPDVRADAARQMDHIAVYCGEPASQPARSTDILTV